MKKREIPVLLCSAMLMLCMASPSALAAERSAACYYPVEVESYIAGDFGQPRIRKVYQLALSDDPAGIPTGDFNEYGMTFHFVEMTRKAEVGVSTQPLTKTVTSDSSTGDLGQILKQLEPEIEAKTEDGYAGKLKLDYNSVKAEAKGYKTKTRSLSATRTYANLSNADLSLVPKTITDGGKTLELADVTWSNTTDTEGEETVTRYTATASYTGSSSSRYCTGYTVTANYTGEVAKTDCELITYTAIFEAAETSGAGASAEPSPEVSGAPQESDPPEDSSSPAGKLEPEGQKAQESSSPAAAGSTASAALSVAGCVGGIASLLAAICWAFVKFKERKNGTS